MLRLSDFVGKNLITRVGVYISSLEQEDEIQNIASSFSVILSLVVQVLFGVHGSISQV